MKKQCAIFALILLLSACSKSAVEQPSAGQQAAAAEEAQKNLVKQKQTAAHAQAIQLLLE